MAIATLYLDSNGRGTAVLLETLVLLRHLLDQGLGKTAIAEQTGVSRGLIYHLLRTGQLDRDPAAPRPARARPHRRAAARSDVSVTRNLSLGDWQDPNQPRQKRDRLVESLLPSHVRMLLQGDRHSTSTRADSRCG